MNSKPGGNTLFSNNMPAMSQWLVWLLFIGIGFYIKPLPWGFSDTLLWSSGNTLIYAIAIHVNLYFLIPGYMYRPTILPYLSLLVGLSLLLTPFAWLFNGWMAREHQEVASHWLTLPQFHFINLVVITALSSLVRIPVDWLRVQAEKKELQTRNVETELQSLKNQINPHFLFNTLNNLYALTLKKSDLAPQVVLRLSDMMRYMLYECNESKVSIGQEMRYINNYLELERLRYASPSQITIDIDEDLSDLQIAPLLLIPFVENSFKHGMQTSLSDSFVKIKAVNKDGRLLFEVVNSKPPASPGQASPRPQGGVGLVNVKRRLELLYPERHQLEISDAPESYTARLTIDLNEK
ncbi:MAG: histidine kinase [Saprospiraceae bacterium]|nr:histidine kinase [Saprospiraceae bacterium]